ncbi:MAG: hypothetical protein IPQ09_23000 [Myxococcales bacterium]|nr:hypothetical protein [Myxococcales bacterium]
MTRFPPERHAERARRGHVARLTVTVAYQGRKVVGKVIALVPSLDQATRRAPVEIEVPTDASTKLSPATGFVRADRRQFEVALRVPAAARRVGPQNEGGASRGREGAARAGDPASGHRRLVDRDGRPRADRPAGADPWTTCNEGDPVEIAAPSPEKVTRQTTPLEICP